MARTDAEGQYVTLRLGGQLFGLPTEDIQFTHSLTMVHPVPLSADPVAGMVHVHGRVITVIDLRVCLDMPPWDGDGGSLSVVVDWQNHSYCVLVDEIRDVIEIADGELDCAPESMPGPWRAVADGVSRKHEELLIASRASNLLELVEPYIEEPQGV